MEFCGTSREHDEEGLCPLHLAERWGVSVNQIHAQHRQGRIELGHAIGVDRNLVCGRRRKGHQIAPMGFILTLEDEGSLALL